MITISLRNNFPEVIQELNKLPDAIANKAMTRALNTTIDQGKTQMARVISDEFRVKVGDAKRRLYIERAQFKGNLKLSASLMATRAAGLHNNDDWRGMNLINFVAGGIPKKTKSGKMRQLGFQIKRSGGRKMIPGAFVATNKRTGGTAVFIRDGKSRMPIKTLTTIDIPQMFNTRRINEAVRRVMLDKFSTNFRRELRSVLKGFVKV